jgi:phospho-N-acetylmuramoyl-pentapeptide-transferase
MLYYLFSYLNKNYNIPGAGVFQYITFRMAMAVIVSLLITTVYGRRLIDYLRFKQVGETVRNLGLEGQMQKAGTPTMGGSDHFAGNTGAYACYLPNLIISICDPDDHHYGLVGCYWLFG